VTYLNQGLGLVIADVVTDRRANLHNELIARLSSETAPWEAKLYAAAYRPVLRDGQTRLEIWRESLAVGHALPTMPLWLRGDLCFPVELGATYERTCREQRVVAHAAMRMVGKEERLMIRGHPRYSTHEIVERGKAIYAQQISEKVGREENIGKFLIIDIETGDFEMDEDEIAASQRAHAHHPGGAFFGMRIGYEASGTLGGSWNR
jgi:hypothetical protein